MADNTPAPAAQEAIATIQTADLLRYTLVTFESQNPQIVAAKLLRV